MWSTYIASSKFEARQRRVFFYFMTEIILAIILLVTLILSYLERKDLNDRLMSKSLEDFKVNTVKEEPNDMGEIEEDKNIIPIEDAYEQINKDING